MVKAWPISLGATFMRYLLIYMLIFTARRICMAWTMPWQDVCLSIRLSVCHTPVLCLNDHTYPQFFSASGSRTILVFLYQTGWQYSDGDPLNGASNARGYEKITICDQYRALSRN